MELEEIKRRLDACKPLGPEPAHPDAPRGCANLLKPRLGEEGIIHARLSAAIDTLYRHV